MIDVLLVHPAEAPEIYGGLGKSHLTAIEPPIWPRIIGAYLRARGWSVKVFDMNVSGKLSDVHATVYVNRPRIVAICVHGHQPSASTQQMVGAQRVAARMREYGYDGSVVMLGNHPSALPVQTLIEEPVDYVIDGEGPITLDGLLRGDALPSIPGLVYGPSQCAVSSDPTKTFKHNPPGHLISIGAMLDNGWDLLPSPYSYRAHMWQCLDGSPRTPYAAVYTSLGCPYTCSFCMINTFQHKNLYRMRNTNDVINEIGLLVDKGVRTFKIVDELFVLNRKHYTDICKGLAIINSHVKDNLNIWCYTRPDTVHAEDLPLLREAGIKWLAVGIESGVTVIRDLARRRDHKADMLQTVRDIKGAGISVIGNYIFGLPGDTHETILATLNLAIDLNTEFANFYCAMPYPGSKLYDETKAKHPERLPATWSGYSQYSRDCTPLATETLSAAEIVKFRDYAFNRYFTRMDYQDMIRFKFGVQAIHTLSEMLRYEIERNKN